MAPRRGHRGGIMPSPAVTLPDPSQPFINAPFGTSSVPVSLKVPLQTPSSNVNPIQVLNDPKDAFQITSSRITVKGNHGLCFLNSAGSRQSRTGKSRAQICFIFLSHYSTFSLDLKVLTTCRVNLSSCNTWALVVCFPAVFRILEVQKSNYSSVLPPSLSLSLISISMHRFEVWPPSEYHPDLQCSLQDNNRPPKNSVCPEKTCWLLPPHRVKIKFCFHTWLVGGAGLLRWKSFLKCADTHGGMFNLSSIYVPFKFYLCSFCVPLVVHSHETQTWK